VVRRYAALTAWGSLAYRLIEPDPRRREQKAGSTRQSEGSVTTLGEVTERPKVRHWKCRVRVKLYRGFESHPLRS
jgi:hypothetical protein